MFAHTWNNIYPKLFTMGARVLVPVASFDPWARAIARTVVRIESDDSIVVELIHIFDEGEKETIATNLGLGEGASIDELSTRKSEVTAAAEIFDEAGFDYEISGIESEEPGRAILSHSDEKDADRIYMYRRKRSPVGKAVFGSASQDVLSNASVPVVVLPASAGMSSTDQATSSD